MKSENSFSTGRWQKQFAAVLLETDRFRLAMDIEAAEAAVLVRLETMAESGAGDCAERDAIADAFARLQVLKRERLGFCASLSVEGLRDGLCAE